MQPQTEGEEKQFFQWDERECQLEESVSGRPGGQKKVRGNRDMMKKGSDTIT